MTPKLPGVPQEGGLVQRWESVCWEVVGIPLIENANKFLGFFVSKFQRWNHFMFFFNILIPYYKMSIRFVARYWFHITKSPFHVFEKTLIPYSIFINKYVMFSDRYWPDIQDFRKNTDLRVVVASVRSNIYTIVDLHLCDFSPKYYLSKMVCYFSECFSNTIIGK